jgi:crotonobetainyl-CoA:carnitine CoA-transferase CaiB-like acyl-CoA transferase
MDLSPVVKVTMTTGPLTGTSIIDATASLAGAYGARLLADLGATVYRLRDTRGLSLRIGGREVADWAPGLHYAINAGKESLALDVETPDGVVELRSLLASTDLVIEDVGLFDGDTAPLRWEEAVNVNASLVALSVTPFGTTGPYAFRPSSDLTQWALSGLAWTSPGVPDTVTDLPNEPPLGPTGVSAPSIVAGAVTAVAALAHLRNGSTKAFRIEVSELEALVALNYHPVAQFEYLRDLWPRGPNIIARQPNCYLPCKDGWLVLVAMSPRHWGELVEAMGSPEWAIGDTFENAPNRAANWDALEPLITEWTSTRTGREITEELQGRGLPVYWSATLAEAVNSDQVSERGFIRTLPGSDGRSISFPGLPFKLSGTGGLSSAPERSDQAIDSGRRDAGLPLAGVRVLDFGQYIAAPYAAKWLGALGADVIQVESRNNPFDYRNTPPFADGVAGMNRAAGYNVLNAGKRSVALNLRTEQAQGLARQLAETSDVVIENYSTGAMERWGLGYETLRAANPGLVYTSVAAFGRTGPLKDYGGLHSIVNAFSGLADVTGYAGGHPRILGSYFPDVVTGTYAVLATLAALRNRENTGMGQYVDLAMTECLMTLLPEPILTLTRDGRKPSRDGNHHPLHAPHNVYPCQEEDQWLAISVLTEEHWSGLCRALGRRDWAVDARFASAAGRKAFEQHLDPAIGEWTAARTKGDAARILLTEGVPAAPVLEPSDLVRDEHLVGATAFIAPFDHPEIGPRFAAEMPWRIDGKRVGRREPAPLVGQFTKEVLRDRLGLSDHEIADLDSAGALT